jgi:type II secretory pathway predicted ATPase ExeA
MYLEHFGLAHLPFQITPDVRFYFNDHVHRRALLTVKYGLSKREGFVVLTGEVGAGKTTLIEYLLHQESLDQLVPGRINTTQLQADNLLAQIAHAFELSVPNGSDKSAMLQQLYDAFLELSRTGWAPLVIVDEVQNLSDAALEELRMLTNFQDAGERPVLQMMLCGQPEFRYRLASRACAQVRQRVVTSYHLHALDAPATRRYIAHRLKAAGEPADREIIPSEVCARVHALTGGLPREINRLCDRLLLFAYLEDRHRADPEMVDQVASEMRAENLTDVAVDGGGDAPAASTPTAPAGGAESWGTVGGAAAATAADRTIEHLRGELDVSRVKLERVGQMLHRARGKITPQG